MTPQRTRALRRTRALCLGLLAALLAPQATAQVAIGHAAPQVPVLNGSTLRHRLGIDVAETLLKSQEPEDRQRGFERLGSVGTAQALDLLVKAFEPGGAARSARDRLIAVRALAPHATVPAVRELLVRVMVGVGTNPERPEAIDGLIERAAALALAASGDEAALAALSKAIRQPGHVGITAEDALLAFPPRNVRPLLELRTAPTQTLVRVLVELGDPRAVPALREIVRSAAPNVRAQAAVALARFGDEETLELARHWLRDLSARDLATAGARILVQLHAIDAASAVEKLLKNEPTRAAGLELAESASLPGLAAPLLELAQHAESSEERATIYAALALTGTREAFSFLGGALGARESSSTAALALALAPATAAEAALERALAVPSTRRVALRAGLVRRVALGRTLSGFARALNELARSGDAADRGAAAQARALLGPNEVPALLVRRDKAMTRAIARDAFFPAIDDALCAKLALEKDPTLREALAACLVSPKAAEDVPSDVLLELVDARGLAAPLAVRALARRDSPALRPRVLTALRSDDWLLRSHAALGLGLSDEASALGVLENAYRFETDERVRLALVRALALRPEPAKQRALALARALDAAPAVRNAAALALGETVPAAFSSGPDSAWLDLRAPSGAPAPSNAGALLVAADDLAVPALPDPDGVLLLPALPRGGFSLRLAAEAGTNDAASPRAPTP